jgi:CSLREA domain-containing protein
LNKRHGWLLSLAVLASLPASASAATITVNSTGDTSANDGSCVLREAIVAANTNAASGAMAGECAAGQASPTADAIEFSITGAGPHVIAPSSQLPAVDETVSIDGSTDGGDEIRIDGAATTGVTHGLDLLAGAAGSELVALSVTGFDGAAGARGINSAADGLGIEDSFVGTDQAGTAAIGNHSGVRLSGAGATIRDSWVSGNTLTGVSLAGSGHGLEGNRIGLKPGAGATALANGGTGVSVEARGDEMVIGGADPADANRISGNGQSGVFISGFDAGNPAEGAFDNQVVGNRIGTSNDGEQAVPNGGSGISLVANASRTDIRDNLVSGNDGSGIAMNPLVNAADGSTGPSDNVIAGNLIGTDVDGEADLGNGSRGILLSSGLAEHPLSGNVIGGENTGDCDGDCNLISGNDSRAVDLQGNVEGTEILGNVIGLDATGFAPIGNILGPAIEEFAGLVPAGNTVGAPGAGNTIAANGGSWGLNLIDAADSVVQANLFGVAVDAITPRPNGGNAIELRAGAQGSLIGGEASGEGNLILFADADGVAVTGGEANAILGNTVNVNDELGIDLTGGVEDAFGVTANDPLDADAGPNELQNFPEVELAVAGGDTTVVGALSAQASTSYRVEVFSSNVADASGYGEGRSRLGAFELSTDGAGSAEFVQELGGSSTAGEPITATATKLDPVGSPLSTSEFSEAVTASDCDVTGTSGDDPALTGTGADEIICGLGGDDVIDGGGGADVILGGEGTDEVDYSNAAAAIDADLEAGTVTGAGADGDDILVGVEDFRGTDFDDVIAGDELDNVIFGGDGGDTLQGGEGADTLKGQGSGDTLKGQDGADRLLGGDGGDTVKGGDQDDTLKGQDGKDTLKGENHDDTLKGGNQNDTLKGGDGNDDLNGQDGNDSCNGGSGSNTLRSC